MAVKRKIIGYQYGAPIYDSLPDSVVNGGVAGFAQPLAGGDMSGKLGVGGVGVPTVSSAKKMATVRYVPQITVDMPGVGGPADAATVAAVNAAAAKAAAASAPFVPKKAVKTAAKKPAATKTGGPTTATPAAGSTVAPAAAPPTATNDGTYDWFHPMSYYEDQARTGLNPDIAATRAAYDRQQAALQAQQEGAARLLADFGKSVSQYYADAATKAGQGSNTQAAAQALLGAVGQRAFTGQGAGSIASDLAAAGNGQLGKALATQETNRNAVLGAILNRIVGTDKASEYLTAAKNATNAALSNSTAQNSYGQRLLQGLSVQQQMALNELLGKRADFEAKIPGMIAQRAQEMSDAAAKNMLAAKAFGLKVDAQNSLNAYRQATLDQNERKIANAQAKAGSLSPQQQVTLEKNAATKAHDLALGRSTTTYDANGRPKSQTVTAAPVANYQQALKQLAAYAPGLDPAYYLSLLNQYPQWSTPGQNGRPYIDMLTRQKLVDAGYNEQDVYRAAFDAKAAEAFLPIIRGLS